jgi:glycosyltransferase involved in cell wall biosynthesis
MKVAIVHDWLNTKFGGAENLVVELAKLYPEAPIFTLLYDHEVVGDRIAPERIRSSRLQNYPGWLKRRSRYLLPFIPKAIEAFDLNDYDVVISSSGAFTKNIVTIPSTLHICYCNSPMRFVWDYWPRYVKEQGVGPLRKLAIYVLTSRLRLWDYYGAANVDRWIANSHNVAKRIKKYYRVDVDKVIYPGAEVSDFTPVAKHLKQDYFVTLSSLTPYKKVDMAIAACNRLGKRLIVIGDGPDRARLEKIAGPSVKFAGRLKRSDMAKIVAEAQALIFPNEEDFGIAPVEAMAAGTPVIAYNRGGLTETVLPIKTGIFFDSPTVDALAQVIQRFDEYTFNPNDLVSQANKFDMDKFRHQITTFVEEEYAQFKKIK